MQNIVLDDWQREVLEHDGNVLLCTGRQVGKTYIFSRKAAKYMLEHPNSQIIVVSLTEDQAKLIIVMILDYLERNYKTHIARSKHKPTLNRITLKNKSSVLARPVGTTGDAVRGFTGDVLIIDEASKMPQIVFDSAKPTLLTTAGQIWICSTPFGKEGYFWEAFQNKNKKYKVWHISSEQVIHERKITDSWTQKKRDEILNFLEGEKVEMSDLAYGQEYLGLFLEELQRYFPDKLIEQCCTLKRRPTTLRNRTYSLGVDIARMGKDESSFCILDKINNNTLEQVECIITRKTLTTQTEDMIIDLNRKYDEISKIYIDAGSGSLGVGIFDSLLRHEETRRKIVAINNRARALDREGRAKTRLLKEDLYDNLRNLMEKQYIKFLDDPEIKLSFRSIQYEFSKKERTLTQMKIFGNYSHNVEALIRAAWIVKEKSLNLWIRSIKI